MKYLAYTRIATVSTQLQAEKLFINYKKNIMTIETVSITQDEFNAYEDVRESGVTNMFNVSVVSDYSGLSREKIIEIMSNYEILSIKYGH